MVKRSLKKRAKDKAWKVFSEYIRRKTADKEGYVRCVTCGTTKHWKELQAGHFIDSRNNSVLFDERLVHPQCPACNMFRKGNKVAYTLFMLKSYTEGEIEGFLGLKHRTKKMQVYDYEQIIEEYTGKLEDL